MSQPYFPDEPIPDHLADTGPTQAVRDPRGEARAPGWQRAFGLLSLAGATGLTIAAMLLMLAPNAAPVPENPPVQQNAEQREPLPTFTPAPQQENRVGEPVSMIVSLPTLDPQAIPSILSTPMARANSAETDFEAVRDVYNPFTIIPDRPRSGVEQYTIVSGDTIFSLAERYGLEPETIVWGNDHSVAEGLRVGRTINILPVNGVYFQVIDNEETIAQIAARYQVDPYAIIDSEFNDLFGKTPQDTLPDGMWVVVPGGQREQISWNPVVERVAAGSGSSTNGAISFAPGDPGSCGLVTNPGGTGWVRPISGYQWIQGFSGVHSGVDLSAGMGTPVSAANGGSVIFAGWSSFGYGYAVVIAHGPYTTLYAHLSAINVGCAQYVSAGSVIGAVGSSGNSSGPHLHFEIRYLDSPTDPTYTMPF